MASEQAEMLKAVMQQFRDSMIGTEAVSLDDQRAGAAMIGEMASEPEGVTWTAVSAGGVPAFWVDPAGGDTDRVLMYVHGGGYVIGSAAIYRRFTGHLANVLGCRVLNVDYRLAPEHPHPAAVTDAALAYCWLLEQGIAPQHLAISGDSAGGGLTMATLIKLRNDGVALPAAAVPLSPWIDLEGTGASMLFNADNDVIVGAQGLKQMTDMFLQGQSARDPLAAPLHADLTGLPPLYIQVGGDETLLDDSTRLADNAKNAGVDVTLEVFPEMQHVFQVSVGMVPEATDAVAKIGAWLRPRLGLGTDS